FFFSSRRRHTSLQGDWSSDVCSSDLCSSQCRCVVGCDETAHRVARSSFCSSFSSSSRSAIERTANCCVILASCAGTTAAYRARRSEERRVGKECRSREVSYFYKIKKS